jgi:quinol monooxygenase YgiN
VFLQYDWRERGLSSRGMSRIGRYAKATAVEGRGDELAELMLAVAGTLEDAAGCELYVVNRVPEDPDTVWITEIWATQDECDAALAASAGGTREAVLAVVESFERVDLVPVGGVGLGRERRWMTS